MGAGNGFTFLLDYDRIWQKYNISRHIYTEIVLNDYAQVLYIILMDLKSASFLFKNNYFFVNFFGFFHPKYHKMEKTENWKNLQIRSKIKKNWLIEPFRRRHIF